MRVCVCVRVCVCDALRNLPLFYRIACNPFIYGLSYFPLTIVNRIFGSFLALGDFWRLSCRLLPALLMPLQAPACSARLQMGARAHLGANISISHKTNSVLRHQRKLYTLRKFSEVAHSHFGTFPPPNFWHIRVIVTVRSGHVGFLTPKKTKKDKRKKKLSFCKNIYGGGGSVFCPFLPLFPCFPFPH